MARSPEEQRQEAELQAARFILSIVSEERNVTRDHTRLFVTRCAICGQDTGAKTLQQLQELKSSPCKRCRTDETRREAERHAERLSRIIIGEEIDEWWIRSFLTTCPEGHDAGRYTLFDLQRVGRPYPCPICRYKAAVSLGATLGLLVTGEEKTKNNETVYVVSCLTCQTPLGTRSWGKLNSMKRGARCSMCREAEAALEATRLDVEIVVTYPKSKSGETMYQTQHIRCGHHAGVRTYCQLRQITKGYLCWCQSRTRRLTHAAEVFTALVASHDIPSDPAVRDVLVRTLARIAGKFDHPSLKS